MAVLVVRMQLLLQRRRCLKCGFLSTASIVVLLIEIFHKRMPPEAVDLVSRLLQYSPNLQCAALDALTHPFFGEHRDPNTPLAKWTLPSVVVQLQASCCAELKGVPAETIVRLIPEHARKQCPFLGLRKKTYQDNEEQRKNLIAEEEAIS